jgi:hypothetical protein
VRLHRKLATAIQRPATDIAAASCLRTINARAEEAKMDWSYLLGDLSYYVAKIVELLAFTLLVAGAVMAIEWVHGRLKSGHKTRKV